MSAPLIKYRTGWIGNAIETVECTRETAKCVYLVGRGKKLERREAKLAEYAQYHDSWADAKEYLRAKAEDERDHSAVALEIAEAKLAKISAMVPPRGAA
ncbi:hypothetical protein [Massilia pseudoviolaceinigra]|uniref:hypothetical protein n=1 Tax=Massilia pseudoviolaceinigra TaxID=3057165 RepID=UPI0027968FF9|nr:hypothetical protein [Massilia sp. CCM 9206]MDQ1921672.1 hypothetical protein [Massilia sp. CCM 9206]